MTRRGHHCFLIWTVAVVLIVLKEQVISPFAC